MFSSILWLVLKTVASLLASACLLRVWLQFARVPSANPMSQFAFALTDWMVRPLRRVIPGLKGVDWASLVTAYALCILMGVIEFALSAPRPVDGPSLAQVPSFGLICLKAMFWLIEWALYLVMGLVLLQAVLSWVNPYAPMAPAINLLTRPVLAPIRRVVPLIGGVDLSPLVLLLVVQVLLAILAQLAFSVVGRL